MKVDYEDQQLIDQLKQLPKIEDHQDKDELFQRISSRMSEQKPRKNNRLVPIFTTLIVMLLVFAIVPVLINLSMPETRLNDSADKRYAVEESAENYDVQLFGVEEESDEANHSFHDIALESYVLHEIDNQSTVIYGAVVDDQLQTVIPITIITPESDDLNTQYNQLADHLDTTNWGVIEYLFEHVDFDIDFDNHEVSMNILDEFSIGEGSANASTFEKALATMFTPYEIDKVVFDEETDLGGHIGKVSELSLQNNEKENYKMFQADEDYRKFLVPINIEEDVTIEEAIQDMTKGQTTFNIYPTISEDVQFSITTANEELIVTFDHHQAFEEEQTAIIMIEAILMTAKSFGYEFVTFNHISRDQVGPYDLNKPIEVPKATNPIYR